MMVEKYDSKKTLLLFSLLKGAENSVIQRVVRESENFTAFYL